MNKKDRLLAEIRILDLAMKLGKLPSVKELAVHFNVSIPTIYQDFALLRVTHLTSVARLRRGKGCSIEGVLNAR